MIKAPITDEVLVKHLRSLEKDSMSVFVMADGRFRGALFHGTRFINQMRANHSLGILETMVLGQACLCGALLIPSMKGQEHVSFRYDTNGPAAGFIVEANSKGTVRGYLLQDPIPVESPLENWDLSPFFGPGTLTVTRFMEGRTEPVSGMVEIAHRNIARDLTEYFLKSEQIKTGFNSSIQFDKEGRVIGAGGLFIQAMPGADDELINGVESAFSAAPSLGTWFAEGGNRDDIIYGLFREFKPDVALERDIKFDCQCSRRRFQDFLLKMDKTEFNDILEHGADPVEIICHNCGSVYHYTREELRKAKEIVNA